MQDRQSPIDWRPTAEIAVLKQRAELYRRLRDWFYHRNILEVETPQFSRGATTDPNIESFHSGDRHLRTSAEFHLKRLLAAGCPDVYELGKVFRCDESGRYHNPEFTMLEWYRLGLDHHQLIDEVEALLRYLHVDDQLKVQRVSYRDFWQQNAKIDLASTTCDQIAGFLDGAGVEVPNSIKQCFNSLQDLAMATALANTMPDHCYTCIYDYPASQASLAVIDATDPEWPIANRFEIYYGAVELANGFNELTDAAEQLSRFQADNATRKINDQVERPVDKQFIQALNHGLPRCAGVALGVDRLMMILHDDVQMMAEAISFNWERA